MSAKAAARKTLNLTLVVVVAVVAWVMVFHYDWMIAGMPKVSAQESQGVTDKSDGDCTGDETAGRCADKCPAPTDQGVYFEQGIGMDGELVCGFSYYHQCPYANSVSGDDPLCYKIGQEQQQTAADNAKMEADMEANPSAYPGK